MNQELEEHLELGGAKVSDRLVFQPANFDCGAMRACADMPRDVAEVAADRANLILNAWLDRQRVIYGNDTSVDNAWTVQQTPADTHSAILCCIEKLEPQKHECAPSGSRTGGKPFEYLKDKEGYFVCSTCSKRLKPATWTPV
jgi:hypothetical protein